MATETPSKTGTEQKTDNRTPEVPSLCPEKKWVDGETITAKDLNRMENRITEALTAAKKSSV